MFRRDGLFRLTFRNLVRLGGDEGDELDAAVDEEVAGVAGEGDGGFRRGGGGGCGEDFRDYLLDGRYNEEGDVNVSEVSRRREDGSCDWRGQKRNAGFEGICSPFGKERSSLPMYLSAMTSV